MGVTGKPLMLCGAIGAPGGGVGIYGCYCWYDSSYPTNNGTLVKEGYTWNIPSSKLGTNASDPSKVFQNKGPFGCFRNFFPGVSVHKYVQQDKGEDQTSDMPNLSSSDISSSEDPIGCALMDFSFQKKSEESKKDQWAFDSEITIRNDKFGWALWTTGRQVNADSSGILISLMYCLIFLKKDSSSWSVMGGYTWVDYGSSTGTSYHIKAPGNGSPQDWFDSTTSLALGESINKQYSGIWTQDTNGKGVLEEIELYEGNNKNDSVEILGIPSSGFDCCSGSCAKGYCGVTLAYKKDENKWVEYKKNSSGTDISTQLTSFYVPFKDKKGSWTEFSEVQSKCNRLYYSRSNTSDDLTYLRSFCYEKKH